MLENYYPEEKENFEQSRRRGRRDIRAWPKYKTLKTKREMSEEKGEGKRERKREAEIERGRLRKEGEVESW